MEVGQVFSYTYNDVVALRKDITRELTELGDAVRSSPTVDQQTRDDFRAMRQRAIDWMSDDPSWLRADSQYRKGKAIETDLLKWYDRLRAAGVPNVPQKPSPNEPGLLSPGGLFSLGGLEGVLLLAVVAYALSQRSSR